MAPVMMTQVVGAVVMVGSVMVASSPMPPPGCGGIAGKEDDRQDEHRNAQSTDCRTCQHEIFPVVRCWASWPVRPACQRTLPLGSSDKKEPRATIACQRRSDGVCCDADDLCNRPGPLGALQPLLQYRFNQQSGLLRNDNPSGSLCCVVVGTSSRCGDPVRRDQQETIS